MSEQRKIFVDLEDDRWVDVLSVVSVEAAGHAGARIHLLGGHALSSRLSTAEVVRRLAAAR